MYEPFELIESLEGLDVFLILNGQIHFVISLGKIRTVEL